MAVIKHLMQNRQDWSGHRERCGSPLLLAAAARGEIRPLLKKSQIVGRHQEADAAPGMQYEQIIVAGDDSLCPGRECEFQVLIVLWIAAVGYGRSRVEPDSGVAKNSQKLVPALERDAASEFRTVQNAGDFGIDRGREGEHINVFRAQQRAFRDAVRLERRAYDS
jgi:hypothetical protein